jgi:hypothetical protein
MNRTALAAVAALGLLLTGCGASDSGGDSVTDPATGTAGPGDGPEVAAGADDVVLRIETGGGYVPVDYAFANGPTVLVTGDGLVLQPAPQAADAEQPRLLPYVQHTVDAATLEDVVRLADEAGLLAEPPDYFEGAPQVTDMPSTTVEITADGETWTHSAYALGFDTEKGRRQVLADYVSDALDLLDDGEAAPYEPAAIRLSATETTGSASGAVPAGWPAEVDLATVGSCAVVDDPTAVAAVADALAGADRSQVFAQAGRTWSVAAAVVLPGEDRPCADW